MAKHSNGAKTIISKHGVRNKTIIGNPLTALFTSKNSRHAAPSATDKTVTAVKQKTLPLMLTASFITGAGIITSGSLVNTGNAVNSSSNNVSTTMLAKDDSLYAGLNNGSTVSRSSSRDPLTNTDGINVKNNANKNSADDANTELTYSNDGKSVGVDVDSDSDWGGIESLNVPYTKSAYERKMDAINARNADKQKIIDDALKNNPHPTQPVYLTTHVPLTLDNDEAMTVYNNASKPDGFNAGHATGDTNGNAYPFSQCTWWAYKRRHDLGLPAGSYMGDGRMWFDSAKELGYWTSTGNPMPGDLISFPAGTYGSDSYYGHVAVVEYVDKNGNIITSESGASYNGEYFSRVFTADMVKNMHFIHI